MATILQECCEELPRILARSFPKVLQGDAKKLSQIHPETFPRYSKKIFRGAFTGYCQDNLRSFSNTLLWCCQDVPGRFSRTLSGYAQKIFPGYLQDIPRSSARVLPVTLDWCAVLRCWADALDWRTGLTLWTKTLDWCAGLTRWADALDWRTGLTLWTKTLDWCAGLTRCGADLVLLLFYRREVSKACVLKGPCIKQCRNAPDPVFLLFYILAL